MVERVKVDGREGGDSRHPSTEAYGWGLAEVGVGRNAESDVGGCNNCV